MRDFLKLFQKAREERQSTNVAFVVDPFPDVVNIATADLLSIYSREDLMRELVADYEKTGGTLTYTQRRELVENALHRKLTYAYADQLATTAIHLKRLIEKFRT